MAHCFLQFLPLDLVQYDWVPVNRSFEKQLLLSKTLEDKMQEVKEARVRFAAREWRERGREVGEVQLDPHKHVSHGKLQLPASCLCLLEGTSSCLVEEEWGSGRSALSDPHEKLQLPPSCPLLPPMTIKEPCGRHKWRNRPTIAAVTCVTPRRNS